MNRTYTGVVSGLATMLAVGAVLWAGGLVHLGRMPVDQGGETAVDMPVADEPAGMDTSGAEDPAGIDMSGAGDSGAGTDMPAGAVMITPERQQLIGVRTALVATEDITRNIRTVGSVEYNETNVAHIHTRVTGWIEELYVDFTGKSVERGQPLLGIYSPELVATQE